MKVSLIALLALSFLTPHLPAKEFKVAHFNVRKIFDAWTYSVDKQQEIEDRRAELEEENNNRLATINELQVQRAKMHQNYQKNAKSMTKEEKVSIGKKFKSLGRDVVALEQDRLDFLIRVRRELANESSSQMNLVLDRIIEEAKAYAEEKKISMLVESGGETTSSTPFFIHLDGAKDITKELIKRLNAKKED